MIRSAQGSDPLAGQGGGAETIPGPLPFSLVSLIGYRGTGKTTVAPLVARRLGWNWADADEVLESVLGTTISQLVAVKGEAAFRKAEADVLDRLCQGKQFVIATGGGVVLRPDNRERLRSAGRVLWLTADAETIWQRLQADPATKERRPSLSVGGRAEVEQALRDREALYQSCADWSISTVGRTAEEVAEEVVSWLGADQGVRR